ncbi:MAG TPA: septal ring lytic transglycosylase RlpA family protein [Terriglobales bacterium]|jgi:rare lipoprotein A|nr:septal ring lytic transglycosylase RlpA family protein [Terriglobales bacterium]
MRGRIVQGLAVALLVAFGAAHGPINSSAASNPKIGPNQAPKAPSAHSKPYQVGTASWYGDYFEGRPTASGEPFDMYDMTAAHLTLPLGTLVRVTNLRNHRSVIVRINDRGPYVDGRIVDLSYNAARVLHFDQQGLQRVRLDVVPRHKAPATLAMLREPVLEK